MKEKKKEYLRMKMESKFGGNKLIVIPLIMSNNKPSEETKNKWRNNPNNWIWGVFYYNPEDKRLFPPKKIIQFGYTTNFANPNSVVALIILVLSLIIIGRLTNCAF
jgi:uncharacterized membrane protein